MKYVLITYDETKLLDPDTGEPMDLFAYLADELTNQRIEVILHEFSAPEEVFAKFRADAAEAGVVLPGDKPFEIGDRVRDKTPGGSVGVVAAVDEVGPLNVWVDFGGGHCFWVAPGEIEHA